MLVKLFVCCPSVFLLVTYGFYPQESSWICDGFPYGVLPLQVEAAAQQIAADLDQGTKNDLRKGAALFRYLPDKDDPDAPVQEPCAADLVRYKVGHCIALHSP